MKWKDSGFQLSFSASSPSFNLNSFPGKYSGGSVNMWNGTGQSNQEAIGPPSQHQSHPTHGSMQPPQPMQPLAQDKSCNSGKLEYLYNLYQPSLIGHDNLLFPLPASGQSVCKQGYKKQFGVTNTTDSHLWPPYVVLTHIHMVGLVPTYVVICFRGL